MLNNEHRKILGEFGVNAEAYIRLKLPIQPTLTLMLR